MFLHLAPKKNNPAKATKVCIRPKDMTQQAILSYDSNANNWFRKKQKNYHRWLMMVVNHS